MDDPVMVDIVNRVLAGVRAPPAREGAQQAERRGRRAAAPSEARSPVSAPVDGAGDTTDAATRVVRQIWPKALRCPKCGSDDVTRPRSKHAGKSYAYVHCRVVRCPAKWHVHPIGLEVLDEGAVMSRIIPL